MIARSCPGLLLLEQLRARLGSLSCGVGELVMTISGGQAAPPTTSDGVPDALATRLDALFHTVRDPFGRPYTYGQVAAALQTAGCPVSNSYLSQLRSGVRSNPSEALLAALSAFFGVPVDYFYGGTEPVAAAGDRPLLTGLCNESLRKLLDRAADLSDESQELLTALAERLRMSEEHAPMVSELG